MIPAHNIVAWGNVVPWTDGRQIEQDLIISRALVEISSDPMLREALRFRAGTALKKLHFPASLRYSEDIDLVRTSQGPIGAESSIRSVACRFGAVTGAGAVRAEPRRAEVPFPNRGRGWRCASPVEDRDQHPRGQGVRWADGIAA